MSLQQALALHQQGELERAAQLYQRLLQLTPRDVNLCYLYGVLLLAQKQGAKAADLLAIAYQQKPEVLDIACAYAKALVDSHDYAKVIRLFTARAGEHPSLVKQLLTALAAKQQDVPQEVKALTSQYANEVWWWIGLGDVTRANNSYQTAKTHYLEALRCDPTSITAKHNLAVVERQLGQPQKALHLLQEVLATGQSSYALYHNLGNVLSDMNQPAQAIEYYKQAIQLAPDAVNCYENLADLLFEIGKTDSCLAHYQSAFASENITPSLILSYCRYLLAFKLESQAQQVLDFYQQRYGVDVDSALMLAEVSDRQGEAQRALLTLQPFQTDARAQMDYVKYCLRNGAAHQAQQLLQPLLQADPTHQLAIAYAYTAERLNGSRKQARHWYDYDRFVQEYDVFSTLTASQRAQELQALRSYLLARHNYQTRPVHQTLNGGTQTRGHILFEPNALMENLRAAIMERVDMYNNNVLDPKMPAYYLHGSWSVCLHQGGFHNSHVHPEGRISGVLYIDVPELDDQQGYLAFGQPNVLPEMAAEHHVRPIAGHLVLFPSYMWHGTVPFQSEALRITIAFDVAETKPS